MDAILGKSRPLSPYASLSLSPSNKNWRIAMASSSGGIRETGGLQSDKEENRAFLYHVMFAGI